jgi:hypothetical protein
MGSPSFRHPLLFLEDTRNLGAFSQLETLDTEWLGLRVIHWAVAVDPQISEDLEKEVWAAAEEPSPMEVYSDDSSPAEVYL